MHFSEKATYWHRWNSLINIDNVGLVNIVDIKAIPRLYQPYIKAILRLYQGYNLKKIYSFNIRLI